MKWFAVLLPFLIVACTPEDFPFSPATRNQASSPAPTPTPRPSPFTLTGSGTDFTDAFPLVGGSTIVQLESADSSIYCRLLDDQGSAAASFSKWGISTHSGARLFRAAKGQYQFDVRSNASWSITVTQPDNSAASELQELSGEGEQLVGPYRFAPGLTPYLVAHDSTSTFSYVLYDHDGGLHSYGFGRSNLATESVSFTNKAGTYYLGIRCKGPWSVYKQSL